MTDRIAAVLFLAALLLPGEGSLLAQESDPEALRTEIDALAAEVTEKVVTWRRDLR